MLSAMPRLRKSSKRREPMKASRIISIVHHSPTTSRVRATGQAVPARLVCRTAASYGRGLHHASDSAKVACKTQGTGGSRAQAVSWRCEVIGTRNPWAALLVLCLGFFVILLDTTIVNVAMPTMITSLHASLDQILWVLNAYLLTLAVLIVTAGRLGDILGQRRMFVAGLALFTAASAACGLAQDANQLILARTVQGIGAAI